MWYWAGESNSDWGGIPLPLDTTILGLPNCVILASAEYVLAEGYSGSNLPTPIPNMGTLAGNHFYFQTFVFDAGKSAIVSTNAYDVVMGN